MTKLAAGDRKSLDAALGEWAEGHAPLPTFRVVVVQPALLRDQSGARESVRQLLFAANAHCLQQGVELSVWCNDGS